MLANFRSGLLGHVSGVVCRRAAFVTHECGMGDSAKEISRRLFRSDLKYADVIGAFRSLSEKKRKSVSLV